MTIIAMILALLSLSLAVNGLPTAITPEMTLFASNTNVTNPSLGVTVCTGAEYTGQCAYSVWPANGCIDLRGFQGHTLTFNPDPDVECFLMQGSCNANEDYLDLTHDGPQTCNLSAVPWRAEMTSYTCWNSTLF